MNRQKTGVEAIGRNGRTNAKNPEILSRGHKNAIYAAV
jgi:hypothetical protein